MTFENYIGELKKGWKTLLLFLLGFFILAVLYCLFCFKATFVSNAKVLIQELQPTTFVTELGGERRLSTEGSDKNAILTQMEILSSQDMAKKIDQSLIQAHIIPASSSSKESQQFVSKIQKSIKLKNPTATDIIEIQASWNDAAMAYKIAKFALEDYYQYNAALNKQSVSQTKQYIQNQLEESQHALDKIREQIKQYRQAKASVDLTSEVDVIAKQKADTENTISDLQSQIRYNHGKVTALSSKLGIAPQHVQNALKQVALGQNDNLTDLNSKLNDAQQEYASLQSRYPDTTKKMTALKQNINEINAEIQQQMTNTVGKQSRLNGQGIIKDSVRTQMVNDLVNSQAETVSLEAQKQSLEARLSDLKNHQKSLPDEQKTLVDLQEKEANLATIVNTLNAKWVEANVRESEIASNVNIIQAPTFPMNPAFPTRSHIIALLTLTGLFLGCLTVLAQYYSLNKARDLREVETLLNAPVLGNISWLPPALYHAPNMLRHDDVLLDYQKLVTSLKVKKEDDGIHSIGFSNLASGEGRSTIIYNVAKQLANCQYSVLIIDANFRRNQPSKEFTFDHSASQPDLQELLSNQGKTGLLPEQYIVQLPYEKPIYLLNSTQRASNPYELVNSKNFSLLLDRIKEKFDFILVDMPELLNIPDSVIISRYLDGLVTICGVNTNRDELNKARKLCTENSVNLVGTIVKNLT